MDLAARESNFMPAKTVFGSVSILLTKIKVYSLLPYGQTFHVHTYPELNPQRR